MGEEELRVLELLDGQRSFDEVLACLRIEFPSSHRSRQDLQLLITDLCRKGLVGSTRTGCAQQFLDEKSERRRKRFFSAALNPFFIKLPGWNPQPVLERLAPWVHWMFQPWAVCLASVLILASWLQLAVRFDAIHSQMPALSSFFNWPGILLLWLTLGATKVVHELAHGLTCHHFGGECHEIGMAFMFFSPCLYCDVSDSWILPQKRHRILIAAAGIYIEVLMSALALLLWSWTQPGLLNVLLMNTFLVTAATTVIYNANPLLRYDGYYILADWLEIPNLRAKADREMQRLTVQVLAGVNQPDNLYSPTSRRSFLVGYAFCSMVNRWILVLILTGILYHFLKPFGLQNIAFVAVGLTVSVSLWRLATRARQSISFSEKHFMNPIRLALTLLVISGVGSTLVMLPIPVSGHAPLLIEPAGMRNIYSQVDGIVEEILAFAGESVLAGQPVLRLRNDTLDLELTELQTMLRKRQIEASLSRAMNDSAQLKLATNSIRTIERELTQLRKKRARLTIVAVCDGVLIEPIASSSIPNDGRFVPPLDSRNLGAWLNARTHVCGIAPRINEWQATLYIDHHGHEKIQSGDNIEIKLSGRPDDILHGRVMRVAPREENQVPASLSTRNGGPIATVTDSTDGSTRLDSAIYQATVVIRERDSELHAGMRGTGRFETDRRSVAGWIGAYARRTFDLPY
ncbi:MAG: hypothetical protein ABGZ53_34060 [Fuerstiella sp.]